MALDLRARTEIEPFLARIGVAWSEYEEAVDAVESVFGTDPPEDLPSRLSSGLYPPSLTWLAGNPVWPMVIGRVGGSLTWLSILRLGRYLQKWPASYSLPSGLTGSPSEYLAAVFELEVQAHFVDHGFVLASPPESCGLDFEFRKGSIVLYVEATYRGSAIHWEVRERVLWALFGLDSDPPDVPRRTVVLVEPEFLKEADEERVFEIARVVADAASGRLGEKWQEGPFTVSSVLTPGEKGTTEVLWYNSKNGRVAAYDAKVLVDWQLRDPQKVRQLSSNSPSVLAVDVRGLMPRPVVWSDSDNLEVCREILSSIISATEKVLGECGHLEAVLFWIPSVATDDDMWSHWMEDDVVYVARSVPPGLDQVACAASELDWYSA